MNNIKRETKPSILISYLLEEELTLAIESFNNRKTAGLDDISTEQIKHFGQGARN